MRSPLASRGRRAAAPIVELLEQRVLLSTATLVRDLNPGTLGSNPREMISFGILLYFEAYNGTGPGLFETDGTAGGTVRASEIVPPGGTVEAPLVRSGGSLFFSAWDPVNGNALWKSDGTATGTAVVKSINHLPVPGSTGAGAITNLTPSAGKLFFVGSDGTTARLWVSDGTASGTGPISSFLPSAMGGVAALNGTVYFSTFNGIESSDGTASGTRVIGLQGLIAPGSITVSDGRVFFLISGGNAQGLWQTDGTTAGTRLVARVTVPSPLSGYSEVMASVGHELYFAASDPSHGVELWKTDGTTPGTAMVKDINPGSADSDPVGLVDFNGTLLFVANDGAEFGLWTSDGTAAGTTLLKRSMSPTTLAGGGVVPPPELVQGNTLYFTVNDGVHGWQPWKTDGTPDGTVMLKDINRYGSSAAYGYTAFKGEVYFSADDGIHGAELWATDGTPDGTQLVADINTAPASSNPFGFADLNGRVVFDASDAHGSQPWISDGTAAGTHPLQYLTATGSSFARNFTNVNGTVFFSAFDGPRNALWRTDGTAEGTIEFASATAASGLFGQVEFGYIGTTLLIVSSVDGTLWRSDGTATGTTKIATVLPDPQDLTSLDGSLYFLSIFGSAGALYRSDSTSRGTVNLAQYPQLYNPSDLTPVGSALYFAASEGVYGRRGIWKTDGTRAGTVEVAAISNTAPPTGLTDLNGTLVFFDGPALWKSDGTAGGTVKVTDLPALPDGNVAVAGGLLYFTLSDAAHGDELWESDGTAAGTHLVKDGSSGPAPVNATNFAAVGRLLLFCADDGIHGPELWQTDGTADGTFMVQDINPGPAGSKPAGFTVSGRKVFFSADDGTHGRELWVMNIDPSAITLNYTYLMVLARHYGQSGTFLTGDLDGDGRVDFADLVLLARNYGGTVPATGNLAQPGFHATGKSVQMSLVPASHQGTVHLARRKVGWRIISASSFQSTWPRL